MILESVKDALEKIKKHGLEGDVYGVESRNVMYSIKKGEISDISDCEEVGLGIRVQKDGKLGFAYCVPGKEEKCVLNAKNLSKFSEDTNLTFPSTKNIPDVKTFDVNIERAMDSDEGMDLTQSMLESALGVRKDIIPTGGALRLLVSSIVVGNTVGTLLEEVNSYVVCGITATIHGERTSLTASEVDCSRRLDIKFESIGRVAAEKVDSMRESSNIGSGSQTVVMSPDALSNIFWFTLAPSVSGENVRKNKSPFKGKLGEAVADPEMNLVDDPTKNWGVGSVGFDDEGVASSLLPIISDGVLKNFLYDLKEGVRSDTLSTGNGVRGNFKSPPDISDRNLILSGADNNIGSLFPERGVYIDGVMGAHTANPVSGDFSVVANPAWLIEHGERMGRLDGIMISGNIHECLGKIELADDHRQTYLRLGAREIKLELPSARFSEMSVSSG